MTILDLECVVHFQVSQICAAAVAATTNPVALRLDSSIVAVVTYAEAEHYFSVE